MADWVDDLHRRLGPSLSAEERWLLQDLVVNSPTEYVAELITQGIAMNMLSDDDKDHAAEAIREGRGRSLTFRKVGHLMLRDLDRELVAV
jgi:hypothetical protein